MLDSDDNCENDGDDDDVDDNNDDGAMIRPCVRLVDMNKADK